jgi:hypothetical protein
MSVKVITVITYDTATESYIVLFLRLMAFYHLHAYLRLRPKLRIRGALSPIPLYAFMAWCLGTGAVLLFTLSA